MLENRFFLIHTIFHPFRRLLKVSKFLQFLLKNCKMSLFKSEVPFKGSSSNVTTRNPHWKGRLSTFDLLVLTSLDQFLFYMEHIIYLFTKQATLNRRSMALSLPILIVFPGHCHVWGGKAVAKSYRFYTFEAIKGAITRLASEICSQFY